MVTSATSAVRKLFKALTAFLVLLDTWMIYLFEGEETTKYNGTRVCIERANNSAPSPYPLAAGQVYRVWVLLWCAGCCVGICSEVKHNAGR